MTVYCEYPDALDITKEIMTEAFADYEGLNDVLNTAYDNMVDDLEGQGINFLEHPDANLPLVNNFFEDPLSLAENFYQNAVSSYIEAGVAEIAAATGVAAASANTTGEYITRLTGIDLVNAAKLTANEAETIAKGLTATALGVATAAAVAEVVASDEPLEQTSKELIGLGTMLLSAEASTAVFGKAPMHPVAKAAAIAISSMLVDYLLQQIIDEVSNYALSHGLTKEEAMDYAKQFAKDYVDDVWSETGQNKQEFVDGISDHIADRDAQMDDLCPKGQVPVTTPSWVDNAKLPWFFAPSAASPLVLDLDGDGVELTTFNAETTATFFDIDGDGFAEQTAWVGADDGLLARDLDQSGTIDSVDELFGSPTIDGFALLATPDSNGDHVINQYDDVWSDLVVWQDANGDGVTQDGELHTLSSLGIVSIDLAGVASSTSTINGNPISHTSTYRLSDGSTGSIVDAWFVHDNVNAEYAGDYTLDVAVLSLPTLRGFGELPSLHIAMSQNEDLLDLVEDFVANWDIARFADGATLDADIAEILWTWAGVESVSPTSRGDYIDARNLEFMEIFFGEEFIQRGGTSAPGELASAYLKESWDILFQHLKAQTVFEVGGNAVFDAESSYSLFSGSLDGELTVTSDGAHLIEEGAPTTNVEAYWISVAEYLHTLRDLTTLTSIEEGFLDAAVVATDSSLSWEDVKNAYLTAIPGDTIYGTGTTETLTGTQYADLIYGFDGNDTIDADEADDTVQGGNGDDTLHGGQGNDTVYGDADNDVIYGDSGDDILYGGTGNDILHAGDGGDTVYGGDGADTYVYSGGNDYYVEQTSAQTDTIVLPAGIELGDLTFFREDVDAYGRAELLILVDGFGSIEIGEFFDDAAILSNSIERLLFDDSSTFDLDSFTSLITFGSDQADYIVGIENGGGLADTIYGFDGNDRLFGGGGDDTLDGGIGNDELNGQGGDDIYIFSPGFDKIWEEGGTDIIRLPAGYSAQDLSYIRLSSAPYDLIVTVDGLGQTVIGWQFYGFTSTIVESIDLNGSNAIDLMQASVETFGTDGDDNISGISSGASQNDIIDGGYGNDVLQGLVGDDTYFFSPGTDVIYESDGIDIVAFREGVLPEDIEIYRDVATNLIIEDQNGNKTTVTNHFYITDYSVEGIAFADNTTWNFSEIEIETRGTSSADYINEVMLGDASRNDTIYGYDGNDIIQAGEGDDWIDGGAGDDYIYGGEGNDIYIFSGGLDGMSDQGGQDILHIAGGYTVNDVLVADEGLYHTKITVNSGVDEIILNFVRQNVNYQIETVRFDDGFETDLITYANWLNGTSGNDSIAGNANGNTLIGFDGDDSITGGDGNDDAHGGAGTDTLDGGNGDDLLYGGDGDDILYGKDGLDTLHGGDGADTYVFEGVSAFNDVDVIRDFSVADDDVLDLSDILDTVYDPLTDAISDFIQLTESSGDTAVEVDLDGTGTTYTFQQIALLQGVTGLSSPELLETNGNLLAA